METRSFQVSRISCENCVRTIKRKLSGLEGVAKVEGDMFSKTVTVEWGPPTTWENIKSALMQINYPPS